MKNSMEKKPFVTAIVIAAGSSTRMGGKVSKQLLLLDGKPVIAHTLAAFEAAQSIDEIVVVTRAEDIEEISAIAQKYSASKCAGIVAGGATRQLSVAQGIGAVNERTEYIAIHDGARPLITPQCIDKTVYTAFECKACTVGTAVVDTVKQVDCNGKIVATPERASLRAVQTPQVFLLPLYLSSMQAAREQGLDFTDDCQLAEAAGFAVTVVEGDEENIKITSPKDVALAQALLNRRAQGVE